MNFTTQYQRKYLSNSDWRIIQWQKNKILHISFKNLIILELENLYTFCFQQSTGSEDYGWQLATWNLTLEYPWHGSINALLTVSVKRAPSTSAQFVKPKNWSHQEEHNTFNFTKKLFKPVLLSFSLVLFHALFLCPCTDLFHICLHLEIPGTKVISNIKNKYKTMPKQSSTGTQSFPWILIFQKYLLYWFFGEYFKHFE